MRHAPLLVTLVAGCTVVYDLQPTVLRDGGTFADARVCRHDEPFVRTDDVPIDGNYSVEAARFNPERSLAYLSLCPPTSNNKPGCELYTSPFTVATGEFDFFSKIDGVNDPDDYDSYPTITGDAQYLIFGSQRTDPVNIWIATKQNGTFANSTPVRLNLVAGAQHSNEPYVLANGTTLYFAAGSSFAWDLYRATGTAPTFGNSQLVAGISESTANEFAPVVSEDELEIYFASNRHETMMDELDLYTARRTTTGVPFDPPTKLSMASQAGGNDWPVWLSPDLCDLYYINKQGDIATLRVAHR